MLIWTEKKQFQFPNFKAINNHRGFEMPLKLVNHSYNQMVD